MAGTMRGAVLTGIGRPLEIADLQIPPLSYGQVLVRLWRSGICGSQIGEMDGVKGPDPHLPHLLGHEGSGIVEEVGQGVTTVRPGDAVVLHWRKGAGIQSAPPSYRWGARTVNAGWVTTFNEKAVVSENRLTAIPRGVDPDAAALLGCAVTSGFGVVTNTARVRIGESVVVLGAGGVGLCAVLGASLASACPVVAVDLHPGKLDLARRLGATAALDARQEEVDAAVRAAVGGDGADVVIETTGHVPQIERAYALTHPRGRTILVGVPPAGSRASFYTLPLHSGKVLTGTTGGEAAPHEEIPRYLRLLRERKVDLSPLVTDTVRLEGIQGAVERLRRGEILGRCMIRFAEPPA